MSGPLQGPRVLDIATIVAAPFAATMLADYGAEVVKTELPGTGDGARGFGPFKDGHSLWWKVLNRNKKLITLDLRKPEGLALFKQMLPQFDILIENFRPGTLDRWGLAKEVLWAIQPRLVILRATGFGQTGPYRDRTGFARVFEAMGGLTYITGEANGEPVHCGYPIGDALGGLFGAMGVQAAKGSIAPINSIEQVCRDPQMQARDAIVSVPDEDFGTVRMQNVIPRFVGEPGQVRHSAGSIGHDNAEFYGERMGLSTEERRPLAACGAI